MLFEVSQVGRVVPPIAQIPFRDNAKRADGQQRARVRSVQHVITVAIVDEFPLDAARQVQSRMNRSRGSACELRSD
jgi:hypothetical protein